MNRVSLTAKQLTCERGERRLFTEMSFSITSGHLLQITGPNGCGKTTLLRILTGLLPPASGAVLWHDRPITDDLAAYQSNLIYLAAQGGLRQALTVRENLALMQSLRNTASKNMSHNEALEAVGLKKQRDQLVGQLSLGQQQRARLAQLLVVPAPLWILDEPLIGLDKQGVECLLTLLKKHVKQNGVAVLTSHQDLDLAGAPVQTVAF